MDPEPLHRAHSPPTYLPPTKDQPATFAVLRFAAEKNARWTSIFGAEQAAALNPSPFLALSCPFRDLFDVEQTYIMGSPNKRYVFVVSPQKPRGLISDFYVAIAPAGGEETRVVIVDPPLALAGGAELFIYTAPVPDVALVEDLDEGGVERDQYHLDNESYSKFLKYVNEDLYKFERLVRTNSALAPQFFEYKDYGAGWRSWNGTRQTDSGNPQPSWLYFDKVPFVHLNIAEPPKLFADLGLYQQLTEEYSWWGLTNTIFWVRGARQTSEIPAVEVVGEMYVDSHGEGTVPSFSEEQRSALAEMTSLHSAFVEGPVDVPTEESGNYNHWQTSDDSKMLSPDQSWDWPDHDDDPVPDFESSPALAGTIVYAQDLRVVIFDVHGALFNREGAIQDALLKVIPTAANIRTVPPQESLSLFIEYEASRYQADPEADPQEIVRDTLRDVARYVGVSPFDDALHEATQTILRPSLQSDALSTVQYLHAKGLSLLCLCPTDILVLLDHVQGSLPPDIIQVCSVGRSACWYDRSTSLYSSILDKCRTLYSEITPQSVAIVTTSPHRIIEPAHAEGFPTVLICRSGDIESQVVIRHSPPTYVLHQLQELIDTLPKLSIAKAPLSPDQRVLRPAYRIRFYQTRGTLGHKGNVFDAYHLLTGRWAAIKIELHLETPGEPCVLPYEATVHRLLEGYPGIPRIRWAGMEKNCHVIIMERLGPNIAHLRQFCRGTLTLRTVLILAEQMLTLVEYAHSKGIVLRDVKPENFMMGHEERDPHVLYLIDFGLARPFVDPKTGKHIPFRGKLLGVGTALYSSYNAHFGREQSRRDDLEALGISLLSLLHAVLPWEVAYAPDQYSKYLRTGAMKEGEAMKKLLARSPDEFTAYFDHCRGLAFDAKPDYMLLKTMFRERMAKEGWTYDPMAYDWMGKTSLEYGTVEPGDYKFQVLPRNREFARGPTLQSWKWMWLSDKMV